MPLRKGGTHRRLRRYFASLKRLQEADLPYLTRFTIPPRPAPSPPRIADFPGLLFLQYSEERGAVWVTAYWKGREAAIHSATSLAEALAGGGQAAEGYLRQLLGREPRWWKRIALGSWILYAASLFGAFAVVQTYFARVLEKPDVSLEMPGPRVLHALEADEVHLDLAITNRSREVQSVVTLATPSVARENGTPMDERFQGNLRPAAIAPSATTAMQFVGEPLPVGLYTIRVRLQAQTGYLAGPRDEFAAKQLRVWSLEPDAAFVAVGHSRNPRGADLNGQVFVGAAAPNGLSCQATIEKEPTVEFAFVAFPGVKRFSRLPDAMTPGLEVRTIAFATAEPLERLTSHHFTITVKSAGQGVDWERVRAEAKINCARIEKDIPQ